MNEEKDEVQIKSSVKPKLPNVHPWMVVSIILGLVVIGLYFTGGGITGMTVLSEKEAGELMVDFLNEKTGGGVELTNVENLGSMYKVNVLYRRQPIPVYMTKNGEYFIQGIEELSLTGAVVDGLDGPGEPSVIKTAEPIVELFIMTHCPYGTQAEKGIIPVLRLLDGKIEGTIRFVHYYMHEPEETETPRQVCIREEQPDKFLDYLACFLEDGDSDRCLTEASVDKAKMQTCIDNGNADEYYAEDSELSQGYGVRGSPSLVINGQQSSAGRDAQSYLDGICESFLDAPSECDEELSSTSPSPGFGYLEGEATTAQC